MASASGIARRTGRRFLSSLPALLGVLIFTFLLMRVLPGDPAVFFASGPNAGKAEIKGAELEAIANITPNFMIAGMYSYIDAKYKEYVNDIRHAGEHLLSLISDLLDISKIEAGKMELSFEAVPLDEVVAEVVALMQPQANRERELKQVLDRLAREKVE